MKGIQDTTSSTLRQLLGNGLTYGIPKFQRDYSWENEQWDDLWQDIQSVVNGVEPGHYLGYLVLQTKDDKNFRVIDGQQHLEHQKFKKALDDITTLSFAQKILFFKASI